MRLAFRSVLTEKQLERMEQHASQDWRTEEAFSAYRQAALAVRIAARAGDKDRYNKACKHLEDKRERLDWILR